MLILVRAVPYSNRTLSVQARPDPWPCKDFLHADEHEPSRSGAENHEQLFTLREGV